MITKNYNLQTNLTIAYKNAPETDWVYLNKNSKYFDLSTLFKYLRSIIDFMINDSTNIKDRISKAKKAIRALRFI